MPVEVSVRCQKDPDELTWLNSPRSVVIWRSSLNSLFYSSSSRWFWLAPNISFPSLKVEGCSKCDNLPVLNISISSEYDFTGGFFLSKLDGYWLSYEGHNYLISWCVVHVCRLVLEYWSPAATCRYFIMCILSSKEAPPSAADSSASVFREDSVRDKS